MEVGAFLDLAVGIASALAEVHARNIVHRDLKPENILHDPDTGQVRLIDFGLAAPVAGERQSPGGERLIEGSLAYISPEQTGRTNRAVDQRSDLYSLGVTLLPPADRAVAVRRGRSARVGARPRRASAGAPVERRSVAAGGALGGGDEAAGQGRRRTATRAPRGLRLRPGAVPGRSGGGRGRIAPFALGAARRPRPAADSPTALRPRAGAGGARSPPSSAWSAAGAPELVLVRATPASASRRWCTSCGKPIVRERGLFVAGQVRPVQARRPLLHHRAGVHRAGAGDPGRQRRADRRVAAAAAGRPGQERRS